MWGLYRQIAKVVVELCQNDITMGNTNLDPKSSNGDTPSENLVADTTNNNSSNPGATLTTDDGVDGVSTAVASTIHIEEDTCTTTVRNNKKKRSAVAQNSNKKRMLHCDKFKLQVLEKKKSYNKRFQDLCEREKKRRANDLGASILAGSLTVQEINNIKGRSIIYIYIYYCFLVNSFSWGGEGIY